MSDCLVARAARTVDGATLFARNSNRRGREAQPFVQLSAAFHPRGSRVRCTHREIDQVAETYRVMGHSPVWCWGFEHGVNEFGVAIGNQANWSREPLENLPGLIGMDLVRLGLERGRDAREALEVIATLVESHGQGGAAYASHGDAGYQSSFVIADGRSAWILETTARRWAARSVDGACLTNALTLGTDWEIGSRDLERHAAKSGYWSGTGRLDFRAAYARDDVRGFLTQRRLEASQRCLAIPALSLEALEHWLRDHGRSSEPPDALLESGDPGRYSICMHADPMSTTTASMVVRLPEANLQRPWPVWISFATPCTGLFLPVYLEGSLPAPIASPGQDSIWEAMRLLQERAARNFSRSLPTLRAEWSRIATEIESERARAESEAASLVEAEQPEASATVLTAFMARTAERVMKTSRRLAGSI